MSESNKPVKVSYGSFLKSLRDLGVVENTEVSGETDITADNTVYLNSKEFKNVEFRGVGFKNITFRSCCFTGCTFLECSFDDVIIINSNVTNCSIEGCSINGGRYIFSATGLSMTSVNIDDVDCNVNLSGATINLMFVKGSRGRVGMDSCVVHDSDFTDVSFTVDGISGCVIAYTDVECSSFKNGQILDTTFVECTFNQSAVLDQILNKCTISETEVHESALGEIKLYSCGVIGCAVSRSELSNMVIGSNVLLNNKMKMNTKAEILDTNTSVRVG